MTHIPGDLQLVLVSALAALIVGGGVRVFGARWLLMAIWHAGGAAIRRRGVFTLLLGATASAGLAAVQAAGL
ncbi:hypothetical protein [Hyphobacterium sp.]|jgi:hypothetical protein|uniref:hypothetical protein n=1 Tax=Hyphobacterium sp. TaxID=2004662 RepID=UPI003BAA1F2D